MIRIIASDMDGTLLNPQEKIPHEFWELFEELYQREILFAVASGRQYATLKRDFREISDRIIYIAENGTLVKMNGIVLHVSPIDRTLVRKIIQFTREQFSSTLILSGVRSAYIEPVEGRVMEMAKMYCEDLTIVPDLTQVEDEFIKIGFSDSEGAEIHSYPLFKRFEPEAKVVLSAENWIDIMSPEASKGTAMKGIMKHFEISPHEAVAFGDYLNNCELFDVVGKSYAMANAHPKIKAKATHHTLSNSESGVVHAIKNELLLW